MGRWLQDPPAARRLMIETTRGKAFVS